MKVLNLHTFKNGLHKDWIPKGGAEKAVIDFHNLLEDNGIEVITDMSNEPPNPVKIISQYEKEKPTVVVMHACNSLFKKFTKLGIPVYFIDHQSFSSINKLMHFDLFANVVPEARKIGSKYVTVSPYSLETKSLEVVKQKIVDEFQFDDYIQLQYVTHELKKQKVVSHENYGCLISKFDPVKMPHRIDILRKKCGMDYKLYSTFKNLGKSKEILFFEERIKKNQEIMKRLEINFPRDKMMKSLSKATVYFTACAVESAGIAPFEAFCSGVPCVFYSNNGKHSSEMFLPKSKGFAWDFINIKEGFDFVDKVKYYTIAERKRIQDMTFALNGENVIFNQTYKRLLAFQNNTSAPRIGLLDFV